MIHNNVPHCFWGEAVLTSAYLINRLPSKILGFSTPIQRFQKCFPNQRILNSLAPRVFGCTAYVYNACPSRGKLDPRAIKCIFVGYSPTQKGYKCYCPASKRVFVTCDVIFFETQSFYPTVSLQGESLDEDIHWDPSISLPISLSEPGPIPSSTHEESVQGEDVQLSQVQVESVQGGDTQPPLSKCVFQKTKN